MCMAFFSIGLSFLSSNAEGNLPDRKKGRRKLLSAEARRILSLLGGNILHDNDILKDENGRPYFPGLNADLSISHSGDITAVSMVKGEKLRTGCDIELVKRRVNIIEIAKKYFSASERDYIFKVDTNPHDGKKFFIIWTLKECFLKLNGFSVFDMYKAPSFINDEGHFAFDAPVSSPLSFYAYELKGMSGETYVFSTAVEGAGQLQPDLRWYSKYFLPARSIVEIKAEPSPTETVSPKM